MTLPLKFPINDPRLTPELQRTRSGPQQVFYTGRDCRDWDRWRAEGGNNDGAEMHDKPDVIRLDPPAPHYYAELIEGEWWWVNGCAECNGQPRDWMTYIECDKHNRCRTCGKGRREITEAPWGGKHGWQCVPCADAEHEAEKVEALAAMPEEYDPWDYRCESKLRCPYCNYVFQDDHELVSDALDDELDLECHRCDHTFKASAECDIRWTMTRLEDDDES